MTDLEKFYQLVEWFKSTPYNFLKIEKEDQYHFASLGNYDGQIKPNIILGFASKHDENLKNSSYLYINGRVCFDHAKIFNKWSDSLQPIFLPETKEQFDHLVKLLNYVSSDEYLNFYNETDLSEINDPILDKLYEPLADICDYSDCLFEHIPAHLQHLYKED